ncbi:MAG: cation diffusion facilitator family transporter [Gemmatimonadales bacterium]
MPHNVSHGAPSEREAISRKLIVVLILTTIFMVIEAVAGWVSGALALLADAGHMLIDVGALGLSTFTAWLARRPASPTKTFGYLRLEIFAAVVNGAALIGISVAVVKEAIERLGDPQPIRVDIFLAAAAAGLLINLLSLKVLHDVRHGGLNVRGAYLHVLSDALGSVGALLAAIIVQFTGWTLADPIVSILLSVLILGGAWHLLRESTDVLLEAAPPHVPLEEVRNRLLSVGGVEDVHDLHVWTVTSGVVAMSGHAVVPDLAAHPAALKRMLGELEGLGIQHSTLQLEVEDHCEGLDCLRREASGNGAHGHSHGHAHSHGAGHAHSHGPGHRH